MRSSKSQKACGLVALPVAMLLSGCDVVLGIDEVSSAEGPDSGQLISGSTADPEAGIADEDDAGDAVDAGPDRS